MEHAETIALLMGVAWASGINLYASVLVLGFLNASGYYVLPPDLQILSDPLIMIAAGFMYCVEFFADKMPGVDTGWDVIHTFVRIPAGAILAMGAIGEVHPALSFAAFLVGGTIATGSHLTKAGSRVMINTSPEPVSNWTASIAEDVLVISGLWAALAYPVVFLIGLVIFIIAAVWLLPKIWRGIKGVFAKISGLMHHTQSSPQTPEQLEIEGSTQGSQPGPP